MKSHKVMIPFKIKSPIFKRDFRTSYTPEREIQILIETKEWIKAILLASNWIESYLRQLFLWYLTDYRAKLKPATLYDVVYSELTFHRIICRCLWASIIDPTQEKIIRKIKDARDDISHHAKMSYNDRVKPEKAEILLKETIKIIQQLHKRAMADQMKIKKKKNELSIA